MEDSTSNNNNNNEDTPKGFDELNEAAEAGELTPEQLQSELDRYAEALRQEFETKTEEEPENVEAYTRDFFKKNIHTAAAQIVWLSMHAESESVKASMSKYIIEAALKNEEEGKDPVRDLLKQLQANDAK